MDADFDNEFIPVDTILASTHRTRGVDAFTLTYLRADRQVRKVFTNLVFQSDAFDHRLSRELRQTLHDADDLSFKGLDKGIAVLAGKTLADMVGAEHARLMKVLWTAKGYRNKLFHGQLPDQFVSTNEFIEIERDIRQWCRLLATGAQLHTGYNGFADSHRKTKRPEIVKRVSAALPNIAAYAAFLKKLG
ncbi:hypothetical protein [Mesorhizobium abyssinicae]|uniref:hypothetical protein n=1 Tax=Mesorhizobium abyssinicae TaxID=1209958 RepID=UPI003393786E